MMKSFDKKLLQSLGIIITLSLVFFMSSSLIFTTTFSLNMYLSTSIYLALSSIIITIVIRKLVTGDKVAYRLRDYFNFCLYLTIPQALIQLIIGIETPVLGLTVVGIYFASLIIACIALTNGVAVRFPWENWRKK